MPVDFSVKNDIQPAIFPARGTQKVYTLWVELVESPFDLTDLIHLTAVADPCQDHSYDFAYTSNGACITPSNDYFCNFIKPLRDRGHAEQPIIGMEGVAQIKVTDGIAPKSLDFQIPAPCLFCSVTWVTVTPLAHKLLYRYKAKWQLFSHQHWEAFRHQLL